MVCEFEFGWLRWRDSRSCFLFRGGANDDFFLLPCWFFCANETGNELFVRASLVENEKDEDMESAVFC